MTKVATVNCYNYTYISTIEPGNEKIIGWGPPVRDRALVATAHILTGGGPYPLLLHQYSRTQIHDNNGNYYYYQYLFNDNAKPITSFSATLAVISA